MASLPRLELFRVAVNAITEVPPQFASLDSLAWFSLAGNPVCPPARPPHGAIEHIEAQEVEVGEKLGDGASGNRHMYSSCCFEDRIDDIWQPHVCERLWPLAGSDWLSVLVQVRFSSPPGAAARWPSNGSRQRRVQTVGARTRWQ